MDMEQTNAEASDFLSLRTDINFLLLCSKKYITKFDAETLNVMQE